MSQESDLQYMQAHMNDPSPPMSLGDSMSALERADLQNKSSVQTYPLKPQAPLATPTKIDGTDSLDMGTKPLKIYTFPESLDVMPNTNCIVFQIWGEEDIGHNFTESQRSANKGEQVAGRIGGAVKAVTDIASDVWGNGLSSFSNFPSDSSKSMFDGSEANPGLIDNVISTLSDAYTQNMGLVKNPKKLDFIIKLPMPQEGIGSSYGVEYENVPLGLAGALVGGLASGQSISDLMKASAAPLVRAAAGWAVGQLDTGGNQSNFNIGSTFEAVTRSVQNPRKEVLFKGVKYREFSYSFTFAPNNNAECFTVREIIRLLKSHMMPTMVLSSFYLRFPSEFDISYHFNDGVNPYVNNIGRCCLTALIVSYGAGNWSTLINGSPTIITIKTNFMELEPISRNRLESEGY